MSGLQRIYSRAVVVVIVLSLVRSASALTLPHVGCPNVPVQSLARSVPFYTSVLEFSLLDTTDTSSTTRLEPDMPHTTTARTAHLVLGDECLDLTQYGRPEGKPFPVDSHGNDQWFQHIAIVVSNMHAAYARLRKAGVQSVSNEPQVLPESNRAAAGIGAFYFRDPDGHYLELIHFPQGKGQAKWQLDAHRLFLGIDHTAIVVSKTQRSLHFYRDELGLHVVGQSDNVGIEQEHLSGVSDAHVSITSLRGASGIGIELLCYVTPTDGRAIPPDERPDDIASWQVPIEINASDVSNVNESLHATRWIPLPFPSRDAAEAQWIKDPDGHLLELVKP